MAANNDALPFSNGIQFGLNQARPNVDVPGRTNLLWDYREGSTVPTLVGTSGTTTAPTFLSNSLRYTKIGERVMYTARLILTAKGSYAGAVVCETNLPFVPAQQSPIVIGFYILATNKVSVYGMMSAGSSQINITASAAAAASPSALADADIANNTELYFSGEFRVS